MSKPGGNVELYHWTLRCTNASCMHGAGGRIQPSLGVGAELESC
jgi:hypothetical protein